MQIVRGSVACAWHLECTTTLQEVTVSTNSVQVVVAYDFSPSAEQALSRAIDVAARAPQHVLHIAVALEPHVAMGPFHHLTYDDASRVSELAVQHVTKALQQRSTSGEVHFQERENEQPSITHRIKKGSFFSPREAPPTMSAGKQ